FIYSSLPGNSADYKSSVLIKVNRLMDINTPRHEICCVKKIFVKTKTSRVDIIDLISFFAVDRKHHMRQRIWCSLMKGSSEAVKILLCLYFIYRICDRCGFFVY